MADLNTPKLNVQLDTQKAKKVFDEFRTKMASQPINLELSIDTNTFLSQTKKDIPRLMERVQNSLAQQTSLDITLNLDFNTVSVIPDSLTKPIESINKSAISLSQQLKELRSEFKAFDVPKPLASLSHEFGSLTDGITSTEETYADFVKNLVNVKTMTSVVVKDLMDNLLNKKSIGRLKGGSHSNNMPSLAKCA